MNGKKQYLDMCVRCDDTDPDVIADNLALLDDEFDEVYEELSDAELGLDDLPDLYDEAIL